MTLHEFRTRRANLPRVNVGIGSMPLTESTVLAMDDVIRDEATTGIAVLDLMLSGWSESE